MAKYRVLFEGAGRGIFQPGRDMKQSLECRQVWKFMCYCTCRAITKQVSAEISPEPDTDPCLYSHAEWWHRAYELEEDSKLGRPVSTETAGQKFRIFLPNWRKTVIHERQIQPPVLRSNFLPKRRVGNEWLENDISLTWDMDKKSTLMPVSVAKRASTERKHVKKNRCYKPLDVFLLWVLVRHQLIHCIHFQVQDMKK